MTRPSRSLCCEVVDTSTGVLHRIAVRNDLGCWPQHLGSGVDDEIRLPIGIAPARVAALLPSGRHFQVTALLPDRVRVRGEVLGLGESRRTEGSFELGPLRITLRGTADDDDD